MRAWTNRSSHAPTVRCSTTSRSRSTTFSRTLPRMSSAARITSPTPPNSRWSSMRWARRFEVRASADAARAGRQDALEASRRGLGPGTARPRLSARGGEQLRRSVGDRLRARRGVLHDGGDGCALQARSGLEEPSGVRRAEAAALQRAASAYAERRRAHAAARALHRPHRPAWSRRDLAREDPDAG